MAEAEWLACTEPGRMLGFLRRKASKRKLRLFACACCRRVWHLLTDERSQRAVEAAEQYADRAISKRQRKGAADAACDAYIYLEAMVADGYAAPSDFPPEEVGPFVADWITHEADCAADCGLFLRWDEDDRKAQCHLLRCIFGNPFRPVTADPAWLTPTVTSLAAAAYEERQLPIGHLDVGRLGVLADALEDAGCGDADILAHCRGPGPHVRGCWVVDFILGKQ
jgi:hypothetical protein